jgi:hypothetical protein
LETEVFLRDAQNTRQMMLKLETRAAVAFEQLVMARIETPQHTGLIRKARQPAVSPVRTRMTFRMTTGLGITIRRVSAE